MLKKVFSNLNLFSLTLSDDFHRINDYIDLEDATEIDEDVSDLERAETDASKTTGEKNHLFHSILAFC